MQNYNLTPNTTYIHYKDKEIYLIGTAHVSSNSVNEVEELINSIQPDTVCIVLDQERLDNILNPKGWEETNLVDIIKQKKTTFLLANLILSSYQKRLADKFGISVGDEMKTAAEIAKSNNVDIICADRNIKITFLRIWRKLNFKDKLKLISALITGFNDDDITEEDLEELKTTDMLESALNDLSLEFPSLKKYLVDERDQYLTNKITTADGEKIVAVVGAAHKPGIINYLYNDLSIDVREIESIPEKKKSSKAIGWIIPIAILSMIIVSFFKNPSASLEEIKQWVLYNGILAALFTALCKGNILTILTAFVAAPITSLNPLLAAGWFAGLTEANIRKPKVSDFENLSEDITTFKSSLNNNIIRILIIVIAANLGSTIGTILGGIGILNIFKNLF